MGQRQSDAAFDGCTNKAQNGGVCIRHGGFRLCGAKDVKSNSKGRSVHPTWGSKAQTMQQ